MTTPMRFREGGAMTRPEEAIAEIWSLVRIFRSQDYPDLLRSCFAPNTPADVFQECLGVARTAAQSLPFAEPFLWREDARQIMVAAIGAYEPSGTEVWRDDLTLAPSVYDAYERDLIVEKPEYFHIGEYLDATKDVGQLSNLIEYGVPAQDREGHYPRAVLGITFLVVGGVPVPSLQFGGQIGDRVGSHNVKTYAALEWLRSPYVLIERMRLPRAARRRWPALEHDGVRVISLRTSSVEQREAGESSVDWQCRWFVRAHWHRYHTREGVINRHLAPYIKGPEDKPLKPPRPRVFTVVR